MVEVFDAVESRFRTDPDCRLFGRILKDGDQGREHFPYTLCDIDTSPSEFSTFDKDVEDHVLTFTWRGSSTNRALGKNWLQAMRTAFHNANIIAVEFTTVSCVIDSQLGPTLDTEGAPYEATTVVRMLVERPYTLPRTRFV